MVIPMRFELMTTGFGNRYSIQLSYEIILKSQRSLRHILYLQIFKLQAKQNKEEALKKGTARLFCGFRLPCPDPTLPIL